MKNPIKISLSVILLLVAIIGCEKNGSNSNIDNIVYQKINKEYVLIRNVQALQGSSDEISNHVDSILSGLLDVEFISTGHKDFKLDADEIYDIGFEIIDLTNFNTNGFPDTLDSLAARVLPLSVEILDNSTYRYPDALNLNDNISENGNWTNNTSVLGTFLNAGQFQGRGERYLGIRFIIENDYKYGWIKLYCSTHNDTLRIIDFAYNDTENNLIKAGQIE